MSFFVKYDRTTGSFEGSGSCAPHDLPHQAAGKPNIAVMEAAGDVQTWETSPAGIVTSTVSYDPVRAFLYARIDAEADAQARRFITSGAAMPMIYLRKETEARAFLADPAADVTIIAAEAAATGKTIAQVAAEVVAAADLWLTVGAALEAARIGAKRAVEAAVNLKDMDAAAAVDWAAVVSAEG